MWKIKDIYEADYGCEERPEGEPLKCIVCLENEVGKRREVTVADEYLRLNHLEAGSEWRDPYEKKDLFLKQKHLLDTFLSTGALSKEQYEFSLNGLITKMDFDKGILLEEGNNGGI
jgi:hypothetical protein